MRTLRAAGLGVVVGVLAQGALSCAPTQTVPTAFFVTVFFNPQLGTQQLVFSGLGANDVQYFPTTALPAAADSQLRSPQSVRILMPDALTGTEVRLVVIGVDENGDTVESGEVLKKVEKGVDVAVTMQLTPFASRVDAGVDAGPVSDGGVGPDGGSTDAGGTDAGHDGGMVTCQCTTGCCAPGTSTCAPIVTVLDSNMGGGRLPVTSWGCGPVGTFCAAACNSFSASITGTSCTTPSCQCGMGAACAAGLRCVGGQCVCDAESCPGPSGTSVAAPRVGCCSNAGGQLACITTAQNRNSCGSTGLQCDACGTAMTCTSGVCVGTCNNTDTGKCCSGTHTEDVSFPRCRNALGFCFSCDWVRSNTCGTGGSAGVCRCGDGDACALNQKCVRANVSAPYQCVPI